MRRAHKAFDASQLLYIRGYSTVKLVYRHSPQTYCVRNIDITHHVRYVGRHFELVLQFLPT